jgi:hypothetical protein
VRVPIASNFVVQCKVSGHFLFAVKSHVAIFSLSLSDEDCAAPSVRLGSNAAPSSLKIQYRSHAWTRLDFCLCNALKNTGHGINGINIESVSKLEHIANRMPS